MPQRIEVRDGGGRLVILVDGDTVLDMPVDDLGWRSLPRVAVVVAGAEVTLAMSSANEWRVVAECLRPDEMTYAVLEDGLNSPIGDVFDPVYVELEQNGMAVTLNGAPWRWFPVDNGEEFWFAPVPDLELEPILSLGAWMAESMAGMVWATGLYRSGLVLYAYEGNDIDGGSTWLLYGEQDLDARSRGLLDRLDPPYELACPLAEPDTDLPGCVHSGWEVSVELSDVLSDETVAAYLDAAWQPCDRHAPELIEEHGGMGWQYIAGSWAPIPTTLE